MSFDGRSPLKDVIRSVVLGAAMISPVALMACKNEVTPPPVTPDPTVDVPTNTPPIASTAPVATADPPDAAPIIDAAPATSVVRPRWDPTTGASKNMPTRGFSGAARARA
jgi:hypothetical protein